LNDERRRARLRALECGVALALVTCVALLHGRLLFHAGGLWRDEVNTVNVAGMPTLSGFWSSLEFDAQPALSPLVLRGWLATGWGERDFSLRLLGCAIGLCALGALWWNARLFSRGAGWPVLSWLLLGAAPVLFKWGDSLRAYGLGTVLSLIMPSAIWNLIEHPSRRNLALALLSSLASVHTLYHNAVLLLVLCTGGAVVGLRKRDLKMPALLLGLGLCCAVSLTPYLPHMVAARAWGGLIQTPVAATGIAQWFGEALRASGPVMPAVWLGLWVGALAGCAQWWRASAGSDRDRAVFLGCVLCLGPLFYLGFLIVLRHATPPWYYLPLLGILAVAIDAAWAFQVRDSIPARRARLVACVLLAAYIALPAWKAAGQRRTTVDICANVLAERAAESDLILVANWAPGITFMRYYHGATPWITLPDVPDHTLHRFDLVSQKMTETEPLHDVMQRLSETLESGHCVWVLGNIPFPLEAAPTRLPPAPAAPTGWQEFPYARQWQAEAGYFLRVHALRIESVLPPLSMEQADDYENLPLTVVSGWCE